MHAVRNGFARLFRTGRVAGSEALRKLDLATSNIMMIMSIVAGNLNWNRL